ncbi:DUF1028 domain-containing protein [Flavobacteriaceae bacterium AU392]|nr:DUF1028 domain-containing protein [Flavobacteriaceae bacterium]RKM83517.1 DUF1028 domain-containing protein [Flavobacteriaceae bacterium AU392]
MKYFYLFALVFLSQTTFAQSYKKSEPFTHTYSIVARDEITGEMGVAVQSHWFSVGTSVVYGEAGVGVVATQSLTNPAYGPKGLALMKQGLSPQQALDALIANDEGEQYRQIGMLDVNGNVATHTGSACIAEAGHRQGKNYSVQANLMLKNTVWDAMANAFEASKGQLFSERLLAALKAAQAEKGDLRGKQSAAILIVSGTATGNSWEDTLMDLRVDDSDNPLQELERLMKVDKAYNFMNNGDVAMEAGDSKKAEEQYLSAQKLFPDNLEMQYWYAVNLLNSKDFKKANPILKSIFKKDENWRILIPRLVDSKLLTLTKLELEAVMKL